MFEIRAKLADLGLDSKGLTKELVIQVSASLRKIGCRCVLDDAKSGVRFMPMECFNRYEPLAQLDYSNEADDIKV